LLKGGIESSLIQLTTRASEAILKHSNPYILARHYLFRNSEACYSLGKYLLNKHQSNPDIEPIGYYIWAGGYATEGKFELMENKLNQGLKKYPDDLNLIGAMSSCLTWQKKLDKALVQNRKAVSLLNDDTPILRRTNSYKNLSETFMEMHELDSAVYFINKAIGIDKENFGNYCLQSQIYFLKSDTINGLQSLEIGLDFGMKHLL
jgi:tetratricopeptide (TPR) repeat protein